MAQNNVTKDYKTALVLVGFKNENDQDVYCKHLKKEIYNWSLSTQSSTDCNILASTANELETTQKYQLAHYGTIIILKNENKDLKLNIINLIHEDNTDITNLNWSIQQNNQQTNQQKKKNLYYISKLLTRYAEFSQSQLVIKKRLLDSALDNSSTIAKVDDSQYYDKEKQKYVSFAEAYKKYSNENTIQKNYLAAGLEISAILGLSTYNYYRLPKNKNPNFVDWDYESFPDSMKNRLNNTALRFDDNGFSVNEGHYYAGLAYYLTARTAGLSRLESLLVTLGASSFWEYISEYKEVVSINDQINTTLGGFILGETTFQMCKIFRVAKTSYINSIMKDVCNAPHRGSNWLQNKLKKNNQMLFSETLESTPDIWAKLDLSVSTVKTNVGGQTKTLNIRGQVISIPMFEEPGQVQEIITDTVFSELIFNKSISGNLDIFKIFAKTTLAAYYQKQLTQNNKGELNGYNLFIGPSVEFEVDESYYGKNEKDHRSDFRGVAHILGSTIDLTGYYRGVKLRVVMDVYGDFAMIKSYAIDSYKDYRSDRSEVISSVLEKHGYYYALGSTQKIYFSLQNDPFEIGASLSSSSFKSIESHDRHEDLKTIDLNPSDKILNQKYWVAYELNKDWRIEIGREYIKRTGKIPYFNQLSSKIIKTYGQLIYSYK